MKITDLCTINTNKSIIKSPKLIHDREANIPADVSNGEIRLINAAELTTANTPTPRRNTAPKARTNIIPKSAIAAKTPKTITAITAMAFNINPRSFEE